MTFERVRKEANTSSGIALLRQVPTLRRPSPALSSEGRIRLRMQQHSLKEEVCQLRRHLRELRMLVEHVRHARICV